MFAYCGNNPISYSDPTGAYQNHALKDVRSIAMDGVGGGASSTASAIAGIGLAAIVISSVGRIVSVIQSKLSSSFARSRSHKYRSPEEVHHLVAKKAPNAFMAAAILEYTLPNGVENPINKISIKTGLHRRLHTNVYYYIANNLVIEAFLSTNDPLQRQRNVVTALGILRGIVAFLNQAAPY